MTSSLSSRLHDEAIEYVMQSGGARFDDIVEHLIDAFGEDLEREAQRLSRDYVRRVAKDALRDREGEQRTLPGFNLPRIISTHDSESAVIHIATVDAVQAQWLAHRLVKESNVAAANAELKKFDELTDLFNIVWAEHPEWTVGQCLDHLRESVPA